MKRPESKKMSEENCRPGLPFWVSRSVPDFWNKGFVKSWNKRRSISNIVKAVVGFHLSRTYLGCTVHIHTYVVVGPSSSSSSGKMS